MRKTERERCISQRPQWQGLSRAEASSLDFHPPVPELIFYPDSGTCRTLLPLHLFCSWWKVVIHQRVFPKEQYSTHKSLVPYSSFKPWLLKFMSWEGQLETVGVIHKALGTWHYYVVTVLLASPHSFHLLNSFIWLGMPGFGIWLCRLEEKMPVNRLASV